jgi:hypothetical protein
MLIGEDQLNKRQHVHATTNTTTATTFTTATATTTSVATTCEAKSIQMKITKGYKYTGYQKDISAMSEHWLMTET